MADNTYYHSMKFSFFLIGEGPSRDLQIIAYKYDSSHAHNRLAGLAANMTLLTRSFDLHYKKMARFPKFTEADLSILFDNKNSKFFLSYKINFLNRESAFGIKSGSAALFSQ